MQSAKVLTLSQDETTLQKHSIASDCTITVQPNVHAALLLEAKTSTIDITIASNASLQLGVLQQGNDEKTILHINLQKDSSCNFAGLQIHGTNLFMEPNFFLLESGSNAQNLCFIKAQDDEEITLHTRMYHRVPATTGNNLIHAALYNQAKVYFEGLLRVDLGAQQTNTYLQDNTLLLSKDAYAQSIPSLEIEANDVKASHGATSGYIDENKIFYLQTRGVPYEEAKAMLVDAYFHPALAMIEHEAIRNIFTNLLKNTK